MTASRSEIRQNFDRSAQNESLGGFRYASIDRNPLLVFPSEDLEIGEQHVPRLFAPPAVTLPATTTTPVAIESLRPAGPLRTIGLGSKCPTPVAAAPRDADFAAAAVWRIKLPANLDLAANPLLRLHYRGDVARVKIGGTFVMDDFYNGEPLELGLARYAALLKAGGELTVEILPLQRGAPIFLPPAAQLRETDGAAVAELTAAELLTRSTIDL